MTKETYMKILMKLSIAALVIGMQTTALATDSPIQHTRPERSWTKSSRRPGPLISAARPANIPVIYTTMGYTEASMTR
jgi:nicotinamidase-related amidase